MQVRGVRSECRTENDRSGERGARPKTTAVRVGMRGRGGGGGGVGGPRVRGLGGGFPRGGGGRTGVRAGGDGGGWSGGQGRASGARGSGRALVGLDGLGRSGRAWAGSCRRGRLVGVLMVARLRWSGVRPGRRVGTGGVPRCGTAGGRPDGDSLALVRCSPRSAGRCGGPRRLVAMRGLGLRRAVHATRPAPEGRAESHGQRGSAAGRDTVGVGRSSDRAALGERASIEVSGLGEVCRSPGVRVRRVFGGVGGAGPERGAGADSDGGPRR